MKRKIVVHTLESESSIWKQINDLISCLAEKLQLIKERSFYGDIEDAYLEAKLWKKMSLKVLRLCYSHKGISGPKNFFDKYKLFHGGELIHPGYDNLFSSL